MIRRGPDVVVLPGVLQGRYEMDLGPTTANLVCLSLNLLERIFFVTAFSIWVDRLQQCIGVWDYSPAPETTN